MSKPSRHVETCDYPGQLGISTLRRYQIYDRINLISFMRSLVVITKMNQELKHWAPYGAQKGRI